LMDESKSCPSAVQPYHSTWAWFHGSLGVMISWWFHGDFNDDIQWWWKIWHHKITENYIKLLTTRFFFSNLSHFRNGVFFLVSGP
jgi:hypothetical protein